MNLHLGCGTRMLEGWENHDRDVDLRKPLPWSGGVRFVYLEHVIEHLSVAHVIRLLSECRRVMGGKGVIRLAFPDPTLVTRWDPHALRELMTSYGHVSAWTPELAKAALRAAGYTRSAMEAVGQSDHPELCGLEQDREETSCVEGWE